MKKRNLRRGWKQIATRRAALFLAILMAAVGGLKFIAPSQAATPSTGSLSPTVGASVTPWVGDKTGLPAAANAEPSCTTGDATATNCDAYTLTASPGNWTGKRIKVTYNWTLLATDYDMVVRQETNGIPGMQGACLTGCTGVLDDVVATSAQGTNTSEEVVLGPPDVGATYYVRAIYFTPNPADQYRGTAVVEANANAAPPPSSGVLPTYDNYQPPVGYPKRDGAPEPSIGVNWNTGNVLTMSRLRCNRTTFTDTVSPADPNTTKWFSQTSPLIVTGLDPILFTDPITGRTICGELVAAGGATDGIISDDDLTTTLASFQTGGPSQGADHQTIGGGPAKPGILGRQPTGSYPHLFYYASQQIAYASVATSFDGGVTYQPAIPAYTLAQCGGLHGHIKVAPDGTVYLPNKGCGGKVGLAVSEDNGLNWTVRTIPTSTSGSSDPSVGIGAGGRLYVSYTAGDNHPHVAVSEDRGLTWRDDFDLGLGITPNFRASVFPETVAGDNNRAAVFFLGTDSPNSGDPVGTDNDGAGPNFAGTWYPYIASTFDGGKSWSVVKADNDPLQKDPMGNPKPNPVQQGVICTNGTTCPGGPPDTRNLADFNEIAVDARGRVTAVYADGCNFDHPCININDNSGTRNQNQGIARLTIIRQRGGMRLFGAFDTGGPAAPPLAIAGSVEVAKQGYDLRWMTPDDGGSPLKTYRIYRGESGRSEKLIAEVKSNVYSYRDQTRLNPNYYYRVTAVNAYGESPRNIKMFPSKGE